MSLVDPLYRSEPTGSAEPRLKNIATAFLFYGTLLVHVFRTVLLTACVPLNKMMIAYSDSTLVTVYPTSLVVIVNLSSISLID